MYNVGQRVSYQDVANGRRFGTVVEELVGVDPTLTPRFTEYRVVFDDDPAEVCWSDMRQAGWRPVRSLEDDPLCEGAA